MAQLSSTSVHLTPKSEMDILPYRVFFSRRRLINGLEYLGFSPPSTGEQQASCPPGAVARMKSSVYLRRRLIHASHWHALTGLHRAISQHCPEAHLFPTSAGGRPLCTLLVWRLFTLVDMVSKTKSTFSTALGVYSAPRY